MKPLFNERCETVLITMRSGNFKEITVKQVAKWLNISVASASPVVARMVQCDLLKKTGSASNTCYQMTETFINALEQKLTTEEDLIASVRSVVNRLVNFTPIKAKEVTTSNGKKLLKIQSTQELDGIANDAINQLMSIINQNKDLRVENELLKEELEKLKMIEEKYNQIKSLMK